MVVGRVGKRTRRLAVGASLTAAVCAVSGTAWGAASPRSVSRSAKPHTGGTLTVLESAANLGWSSGLDPVTNKSSIGDATLEDAIFGELFELGAGGKTIPDLASGYQIKDGGKTFVLHVRKGATFSDGTPFNAAAVAYNFRKDLASSSVDKPTWSVSSITAPSPYTVVVHLKTSDGAIVNQFQGSIVNWIGSPTAMRKESATKFGLHPIGAGPFIIQSNSPSTKLVLRRNPHYWRKGHPYVKQLTFQTVASDESALEDMQSGEGQVYENMETPSLASAFKRAGLTTRASASASPNGVQLNTEVPPFNNLKAREAVAYATDAAALDKKINDDLFPPSESFTSQSGLFYEAKVPTYRNYDLAKARALVKQLGGLSFSLLAEAGLSNGARLAEGLQAMWQRAGMHVTLNVVDLAQVIEINLSHKWNASMQLIGGYDPGDTTGLSFRYEGAFSGVKDGHLDALLAAGTAAVNPTTRARIYASIAKYIDKKAYTVFLYPSASWDMAAKGVKGPGLTSPLPNPGGSPAIPWEDVSVGNS